MSPRLMWWGKDQATAVDEVRDLVAGDPLVSSFGDGSVIVAMMIEPDGSYLVTWTLGFNATRSLPEVELFIAKVATFLIDEPVEPA